MARVLKPDRPNRNSAKNDLAAVTQAQLMIGIYAEIVAMDQTIIERARQLLVKQLDASDRETTLVNLRLVLAQLDQVGERIVYWNARVRELLVGHS